MWSLGVGRQHAAQQVNKVASMRLHALLSPRRLIKLLPAQIDLRIRDPPVPQSAGEVLLMEFKIRPVTGISTVPAPNLQRTVGVPHERRGGPVTPAGRDQIGAVRGAVRTIRRRLRSGQLLQRRVIIAVCGQRAAAAHQVHIGDEKLQASIRHELLDAAPAHAPPAFVRADRRRPLIAGTIRAFRQPDAVGRASEMLPVGRHRHAELQGDGFFTAQQRQVAARRHLRQPVTAVWPAPVAQHEWEMGVENKGKRSSAIRSHGALPSEALDNRTRPLDYRWISMVTRVLPLRQKSHCEKTLTGKLNWFGPLPEVPNGVHPAPVMSSIRTIRLLKVSTTKICPALTKMPNGLLNWFGPLPKVPNSVHPTPVMSFIRTMRLLFLSAT